MEKVYNFVRMKQYQVFPRPGQHYIYRLIDYHIQDGFKAH